MKRIDALWGAKKGTTRGDELEVLLTLVAAYEEEHDPIDAPTPLAAIQFRMDQLGMSRSDLAAIIGYPSRVSEIFSGRRKLTVGMIKALHKRLHIPAESLLG